MNFTINNVFPWGRSLEEYIQMFSLSEQDLQSSILDCGGGPSSFNQEQYSVGNWIISCDPIYQFSAEQIQKRIEATSSVIIEKVQADYNKFVWQDITSPEQLANIRMSAMNQFLDDYPIGLQQGRYLNASLPNLPFTNQQFDLALCSHFLFTYSQEFSLEFHFESILEMCRVAKEVRIFPLLQSFTGKASPYLNTIIEWLSDHKAPALQAVQETRSKERDCNLRVTIEQVEYEFQINGNKMLRCCCTNS